MKFIVNYEDIPCDMEFETIVSFTSYDEFVSWLYHLQSDFDITLIKPLELEEVQ